MTQQTISHPPGGPFVLPTPSSISTSLPTPSLGPQLCNDPNSYLNHGDIHEDQVKWWLNRIICVKDQTFDSTTPPLDWNPQNFGGSKDIYHYRISWIPGCVTTSNSQQKLNPLPGASCYSLLYEDYKNCEPILRCHIYRSWDFTNQFY